jgi:hypothetical protein
VSNPGTLLLTELVAFAVTILTTSLYALIFMM